MNLVQVSVFLGAVLAVRGQDPTTLCFPPVFQANYFNLLSEDKGTIHVDFSKELWVEISSVTGVRTVSDFAKLRTHVITGQGNNTACESFKLRQNQIMYKCLPPYAKLVPEVYGTIDVYGSAKTNTMYVRTYDIPTEYDTVYRIFFSYLTATVYEPFMSQQYGYHGTTDINIYVNITGVISNPAVFTIPPECDTQDLNLATIVG